MATLYDLHRRLAVRGLRTIPCKDKKPVVKHWRGDGITYSEGDFEAATATGLVCGLIGGGDTVALEAIDFDIKYGERYPQWKALVREMLGDILDRLYVETTPSGGHHVLYRYETGGGVIDGNLKLAMTIHDDKRVAAIETRGEGGYIIVSPSKGYATVNGSLESLELITMDERDSLLNIARSLGVPKPEKREKITLRTPVGGGGGDAIEQFNGAYNVMALLEKHGWEAVREITGSKGVEYHLLRPQGTSAPDATYNYGGSGLLYVFSSNADPFEGDRAYSPFSVYSLLEHAGDNKAAFKAVLSLGYGTVSYITPQGDREQTKVDVYTVQLENLAIASLYAGVGIEAMNFGELSVVTTGMVSITVARGIFERVYKEKSAFFGFGKFTTQRKAEVLIKDRYNMFRNTVNGSLFYQNGSSELHKISPLDVWYSVGRDVDVSKNVVMSLCEVGDISKPFDPFLDYLESLTWNGQDEIGKFARYIKVEEQEFHDSQIERMFIRCIHCMLGRGENRFVWTYIGGQYVGKSYLIRFFCPPALKEYYTEEKPTGDKDGAIRLQENAFYNWEELQSSTNHDINQMKAMISKAVNKIRVPYGTTSEMAPRRANFFASTNEDHFLTDDENTRWLTFKITDIDQRYSKDIDIDQVWAQAYQKYKAGVDFSIRREELLAQHEVTDKYRHVTSEEELVLRYFERVSFEDPLERQNKGVYESATSMITKLSAVTGRTVNLKKIPLGRVLSKKRYVKRRDKAGIYTYWVIDLTEDALEQSKNPYYAASRAVTETEKEELPF